MTQTGLNMTFRKPNLLPLDKIFTVLVASQANPWMNCRTFTLESLMDVMNECKEFQGDFWASNAQ